MDLMNMSHEELLELRKDVDKAIKTLDSRRKKEALAAAEKAAREFGYSLSDLSGKGADKPAGIPKYANPENSAQTWTGRGRKPKWVLEWEAAGRDISGLAI